MLGYLPQTKWSTCKFAVGDPEQSILTFEITKFDVEFNKFC